MKKKYITPSMESYKFDAVTLLSGSPNLPIGGKDSGGSMNPSGRGLYDEWEDEEDW